ncbi:hypothetical protein [Streptomyces sp. NPDC048639]|uniref:hypothetical protein n=1 Tax=Streptomyces sp. NPDC048639 TaxID=3365581 RepID=UPI00372176B1
MRRWIKVSVVAAAVLGVGGWIAEPYVQDWAVARSACDGALPQDAVRQLVPEDAHLGSAESRRSETLGSFTCRVTVDGKRGWLIDMEAYTRRDDQDRTYMTVFPQEGTAPQAPLPDGLPGFVDRFGSVQLVLACPDLGRDADGRRRTLLVRTSLSRSADSGVPGAAYRTAVSFANTASGKLGCGAKPLRAPARDAVPPDPQDSEDAPEAVELARAGKGACGWAARAGLPEDGGWHVVNGMNDAAPTGYCTLSMGSPGSERDDTGSGQGGHRMLLLAWYGDWSNRLTAGSGNGERRSSTATARCDGESANFALVADDDIPGAGEAVRRRALETFAKDQAVRRNCTGLRFF